MDKFVEQNGVKTPFSQAVVKPVKTGKKY